MQLKSFRRMSRRVEPASGRAPQTTIFIGAPGSPYIAHLSEMMEDAYPNLRFVGADGASGAMLRGPGARAFHLQWIDSVFGHASATRSFAHASRLVALILLLRLRGVPTIWTCHNRIAKSHSRRVGDRALRTAVVTLCKVVVVTNDAATSHAAAELPRVVRRVFVRKACHVPMPMIGGLRHGEARSRLEARRDLGLTSDVPVVVYLPGTNQLDRAELLGDPGHRFALLRVDRRAAAAAPIPGIPLVGEPHGWVFRGQPTDEEYGRLVSAGDALILADEGAYGSLTLQTAVELRRPVISQRCPAVDELAALGGAIVFDGPPTPDKIADAVEEIARVDMGTAASGFGERHADPVVVEALVAAYERARVPVRVSPSRLTLPGTS